MRKASEYDQEVGFKIRHYRILRGRSQECLASHLGISFQQIQKYERGENRISAGRLYRAAEFLRVDIAAFFEGLPKIHVVGADLEANDGPEDADYFRFVGAVGRCKKNSTRLALSKLVETLNSKS